MRFSTESSHLSLKRVHDRGLRLVRFRSLNIEFPVLDHTNISGGTDAVAVSVQTDEAVIACSDSQTSPKLENTKKLLARAKTGHNEEDFAIIDKLFRLAFKRAEMLVMVRRYLLRE